MRVLVVEDEAILSQQLAAALGDAGYAVDCAADGERADFLGQTERYDAVVLDLGLPKVDGLTLLAAGATPGSQCPVLVLTARGSWHEKVQGIDGGADDYMSQAVPDGGSAGAAARADPARQRTGDAGAPVRRARRSTSASAKVSLDGLPVKLTSHEFRVLSYLMHQRGRVVSQAELTEHIYAQGADRDSNTVEVFIARLRRKLGASFIETVRGLGYRIADGVLMRPRSLRGRVCSAPSSGRSDSSR